MRIVLLITLSALMAATSTFAAVTVEGMNVTDSNAHYLLYVRHMTVPFASQAGAVWDAGNDVSRKTEAEVQAIVDAIKAQEIDAVQKEIYIKMKSAPTEVFAFTGVTHAKAVVNQRLETIAMMRNFNNDGRYTYHYGNPSTTASSWETGPRVKHFFRQKAGSAFTAIRDITDELNVTLGECAGAIAACVWYGASCAMSEANFNLRYPGMTALDMDFGISNSYSRNLANAVDTKIHIPGDLVYFSNHNYGEVIKVQYFSQQKWLIGDPKKKIYFYQGENALYMGGLIYEGLGVTDKTFESMQVEVAEVYNEDLATVITEVGKLGGSYRGLKIVRLNPSAVEVARVFRVVR